MLHNLAYIFYYTPFCGNCQAKTEIMCHGMKKVKHTTGAYIKKVWKGESEGKTFPQKVFSSEICETHSYTII